MTNQKASLEYRRALTQHASVVGLVIALHDTLAGDLRRAADAMRRNDIETRCDQLIHGFQVLTQLEAMLDMEHGGAAAINIRRFYKHLRNQMLTAQFKLSPEILEQQIKIIVEVRQTWQMVDIAPPPSRSTSAGGYGVEQHSGSDHGMRTAFSCSG